MREGFADFIRAVLARLPLGCTFKCGHPLALENVRLVGGLNGKLRCRTCLNESSSRWYSRRCARTVAVLPVEGGE